MSDPELDFLKAYLNRTDESDTTGWSWKRVVRLAWKTWPFKRPMLLHLLILIPLTFWALLAAFVGGFLFGVDLFNNKVLVGEKLQPVQAWVLNLGEEYVTTDPLLLGKTGQLELKGKSKSSAKEDWGKTKTEFDPDSMLTPEQRKVVRNRLMYWGAAGGILGAIFGLALWYYSTWIWQSINQNLRVAMIERAETLSLKYHNRARVGDAIFRVYQDSAMIVNLLQAGVFEPLHTAGALTVSLAVVAAFDPLFTLFVLVTAIPLGVLSVLTTKRIRLSVFANRMRTATWFLAHKRASVLSS